jgi:hypothetical protein
MKGHALLFDGPLDLVKNARRANENVPNPFKKNTAISWPGRKGYSWADMERFLHEPWPEAVARVKLAVDRIKSVEMPHPKDVRRKRKWSEVDGEVEIDRVMTGEPEYMQNFRREKVIGPFQVALVSNLDLTSGSRCNPSGVFFRSTACIAVADVLENLGYSVEIWTWTRGEECYPKPYPNQFIACRPKKFGDPVDYDALCDTMSSWFTTIASFGAIAAGPVTPKGLGYACEPDETTYDFEKVGIGGWKKYLDIEQGVLPICIPMIVGSFDLDSPYSGIVKAVEVAKRVLEIVSEAQA